MNFSVWDHLGREHSCRQKAGEVRCYSSMRYSEHSSEDLYDRTHINISHTPTSVLITQHNIYDGYDGRNSITLDHIHDGIDSYRHVCVVISKMCVGKKEKQRRPILWSPFL